MPQDQDRPSPDPSRRRPRGRRVRFGQRRGGPLRASRVLPGLLILALAALWLFLAEDFARIFAG